MSVMPWNVRQGCWEARPTEHLPLGKRDTSATRACETNAECCTGTFLRTSHYVPLVPEAFLLSAILYVICDLIRSAVVFLGLAVLAWLWRRHTQEVRLLVPASGNATPTPGALLCEAAEIKKNERAVRYNVLHPSPVLKYFYFRGWRRRRA